AAHLHTETVDLSLMPLEQRLDGLAVARAGPFEELVFGFVAHLSAYLSHKTRRAATRSWWADANPFGARGLAPSEGVRHALQAASRAGVQHVHVSPRGTEGRRGVADRPSEGGGRQVPAAHQGAGSSPRLRGGHACSCRSRGGPRLHR